MPFRDMHIRISLLSPPLPQDETPVLSDQIPRASCCPAEHLTTVWRRSGKTHTSLSAIGSYEYFQTADNDGHGSHSETQPPLRPTGFIQNEHGALIPVYQREALDQYMASAHPGGTPAHMNSSSNQLTSVSPTAVVSWPAPPYPFFTAPSYPAVGHPYPGHPPPAPGGYWLPGGPPLAVAPFPPSQLQSAPAQPSSTPQFPATSSAPPGGMQSTLR